MSLNDSLSEVMFTWLIIDMIKKEATTALNLVFLISGRGHRGGGHGHGHGRGHGHD